MRRPGILALLLVLVAASTAPAGTERAHLAMSSSGMVFFTVRTAGPSLAADRALWLQHEVEAIDFVRRILVREAKIENHPVVLSLSHVLEPSSVAIDAGCTVSAGETAKLIGPCYHIRYVDPELSTGQRDDHENLLALTVSLAQLSPAHGQIEIGDLPASRAALAAETAPFKGMEQHFDPIWSPDGRRLIYLVWRDGQVRFELLDPVSRALERLDALRGYAAVRPVWSPDARYVAMASLRDVRIVDVRAESPQTVRPARMTGGSRAMVDLQWVRDGRLLLVFDTGASTEPAYAAYSYNPDSRELTFLGMGAAPSWVTGLGDWPAAHASLRPVRSPTGQYVAFIRYVDGVRRVAVDRLR